LECCIQLVGIALAWVRSAGEMTVLEIQERGDLCVDNAPYECHLVVKEGVTTLGIVPDVLPPDPLVLRHIEVGSFADRNGICSGDELVLINGMRSADLDGNRQLDKLLRKVRPLSLTFRCRNDGGCPDIGSEREFQRASTTFIEDFCEKSQALGAKDQSPAGQAPTFLPQQLSTLPSLPLFSWQVVPKVGAVTLVCEFFGSVEARVGCCKSCRDRATRVDCTVHFDGAKLLDELVEPVENCSSYVPMPPLCNHTDEECLNDSGYAGYSSDDESLHEVNAVDKPPPADDIAADKQELAVAPVPYGRAEPASHQGAVTRERGMHGATGRLLRWLRSDPAHKHRLWPARMGRRQARPTSAVRSTFATLT